MISGLKENGGLFFMNNCTTYHIEKSDVNFDAISSFIDGKRQYDFVSRFDYIREAGCEGEKRAANQLVCELKELGLEPRVEKFFFEAPLIESSVLKVTAPYEKEYTVHTFGFCADTEPDGLEAEFVYIENADDISMKKADGKIVMLNGFVGCAMVEKLKKAGALGFITFSGTPLDTKNSRLPAIRSLGRSSERLLPGVSIHYMDALELVEMGASKVRMICRQSVTLHNSQNICVRVAGSDPDANQVLTVTAHYDSVPAGPGAYDNMAGCAIVMELLHYFAVHKPLRTIEFIWFGAEEKGLLGSLAYVSEHENELHEHAFNMNIDLAGQALGGTVLGITADQSIADQFTKLGETFGLGLTAKSAVWSSDSNTFAWKRVPSMTLNRDGFGMHTEHDTISLISAWSLRRSAVLLCTIADWLANSKNFPLTKEIPEDFLKQLDAAFLR